MNSWIGLDGKRLGSANVRRLFCFAGITARGTKGDERVGRASSTCGDLLLTVLSALALYCFAVADYRAGLKYRVDFLAHPPSSTRAVHNRLHNGFEYTILPNSAPNKAGRFSMARTDHFLGCIIGSCNYLGNRPSKSCANV